MKSSDNRRLVVDEDGAARYEQYSPNGRAVIVTIVISCVVVYVLLAILLHYLRR